MHWQYPDMPEEIKFVKFVNTIHIKITIYENFSKLLMQNDQKLVIVGVIGKSAFPDCNKMVGLEVLDRHPSLIKHEPKEVISLSFKKITT